VVLAADDRATDGALGCIVVEWDPRVIDEAREAVPDAERVSRGFADRQRRDLGVRPEPGFELVEDGRCIYASPLGP